jgi:hypothetical protein
MVISTSRRGTGEVHAVRSEDPFAKRTGDCRNWNRGLKIRIRSEQRRANPASESRPLAALPKNWVSETRRSGVTAMLRRPVEIAPRHERDRGNRESECAVRGVLQAQRHALERADKRMGSQITWLTIRTVDN